MSLKHLTNDHDTETCVAVLYSIFCSGGSFEENVVAHMIARQTSGAEVPGSNPASPTMILGRCSIIE